MQTSVCPSPDELKAYVRGKLDSEQSDLLSQHMLHCAACERTIIQIEAKPDTLVELLKCEIAANAIQGSEPDDQRLQDQTRSSGPAPSQRSDTLQLPTELGQYELQRRLGTGGMGAVYLARHKSLDKQVAIKLLPALPAQHPGFLARFQREMRAAGKLDHPAIVRTTDAGELQGIHFLVMEAIDGMDLSRIVRAEEKLSKQTLARSCVKRPSVWLMLTKKHRASRRQAIEPDVGCERPSAHTRLRFSAGRSMGYWLSRDHHSWPAHCWLSGIFKKITMRRQKVFLI